MRLVEFGRPALAIVGGLLSPSAFADDEQVLNGLLSNEQLVDFCAGHEGEVLHALLDMNGEIVRGHVLCDDDLLAVAEAAIAAGLGAQPVIMGGDHEEEAEEDDLEDDDDLDEDDDEDEVGDEDDDEDETEDEAVESEDEQG